MCSIVVLGLLLKNPASAFIFLGVFFFLRLFSGGYHATTYARCFLLTNSVYLAVVGASCLIVRFQLYHLLPVIVVASCVVVMVLSPIRNKRHPVVRENLPEEPKDRCCSGFHREFAFSDSFLLADLSALCDRLHYVVNSGCCYDAINFKKMTGLIKTGMTARCSHNWLPPGPEVRVGQRGGFCGLWLSARTAQGASEVITSSKEKALQLRLGGFLRV